MRTAIVFALCLSAVLANPSLGLTQQFYDQINSAQSTWTVNHHCNYYRLVIMLVGNPSPLKPSKLNSVPSLTCLLSSFFLRRILKSSQECPIISMPVSNGLDASPLEKFVTNPLVVHAGPSVPPKPCLIDIASLPEKRIRLVSQLKTC